LAAARGFRLLPLFEKLIKTIAFACHAEHPDIDRTLVLGFKINFFAEYI
jgi:hypothetical protein